MREIGEDTVSASVGCVTFEVDMARSFGWSEDDIKATWDKISSAYRAMNRLVASRSGHTRQCDVCECWTVPVGPCHLCERDRIAAEGYAAKPHVCSCGERFATMAELKFHADASGGLMHGDQPGTIVTSGDLEALRYFKIFAETVHEHTAYAVGMEPEHANMTQRAILAIEKIVAALEDSLR